MYRLKIMGLSYAVSAFMDCTIAASRGIGKTVVPMIIVIMGSCIFRIVWVCTIFAYFKTITSLYLIYIFSWLITAAAEIIYHRADHTREHMGLTTWKNSPDGTASRCLSKEEFYHSGEFRHEEVVANGVPYAFHIKRPKNAPADAKLPVVLLLHGHGEPAWLFCYKNGWAELADETGEFVLVLPDSPENAWKVERDENLFEVLLAKLDEVTSVDLERVYLTGFSNGSLATCWYGERHPHLFAAIAPWNSPMVCYEDELLASGYELPIFAINGDLDHKMDVPRRFYPEFFSAFLRLNEGTPVPGGDGPVGLVPDEVWDSENYYTVANGYEQGQRMTSYVFHDKNGCAKVSYTQISEMPHGAIPDEARATWTFIRRFRRPANSKTIEMVEQHVLN